MVVNLTDEQWEQQREAAAQRFYGMDADTFVEEYAAGRIDNERGCLTTCLSFFPELDW